MAFWNSNNQQPPARPLKDILEDSLERFRTAVWTELEGNKSEQQAALVKLRSDVFDNMNHNNLALQRLLENQTEMDRDLKCKIDTIERFDKNILERIKKLEELLKNPVISAIINCGYDTLAKKPVAPDLYVPKEPSVHYRSPCKDDGGYVGDLWIDANDNRLYMKTSSDKWTGYEFQPSVTPQLEPEAKFSKPFPYAPEGTKFNAKHIRLSIAHKLDPVGAYDKHLSDEDAKDSLTLLSAARFVGVDKDTLLYLESEGKLRVYNNKNLIHRGTLKRLFMVSDLEKIRDIVGKVTPSLSEIKEPKSTHISTNKEGGRSLIKYALLAKLPKLSGAMDKKISLIDAKECYTRFSAADTIGLPYSTLQMLEKHRRIRIYHNPKCKTNGEHFDALYKPEDVKKLKLLVEEIKKDGAVV